MLIKSSAKHINSSLRLWLQLYYIVDDVMYVLENTLTNFEKENEEERKLDREVTIYQKRPETLDGWRKMRSEVRLGSIHRRIC